MKAIWVAAALAAMTTLAPAGAAHAAPAPGVERVEVEVDGSTTVGEMLDRWEWQAGRPARAVVTDESGTVIGVVADRNLRSATFGDLADGVLDGVAGQPRSSARFIVVEPERPEDEWWVCSEKGGVRYNCRIRCVIFR